ncbi:MAG: glucosaminidase domain-containing protein [Bacteroidales bacterium]|nr:glucosaminidase domain-containing protein [Bacteroidales bacterium]
MRRYAPLVIPLILIGFNLSFFPPADSPDKAQPEHPTYSSSQIDSAQNNKAGKVYGFDVESLEDYAWEMIDIRGVTPKTFPSYRIMSRGNYSADRLAAFLKQYNRNIPLEEATAFARLYMGECRREGVNHDIAFAQMCLETGFLKYGGVVKPEQNNYCGLGALNDHVSGDWYPDRRTGIMAHIQHLKAYASTGSLNNLIVDKRFDCVKRGSAKHLAQLTGKWAIDRLYDKKIKSILNRMEKFNIAIEFTAKDEFLVLNFD